MQTASPSTALDRRPDVAEDACGTTSTNATSDRGISRVRAVVLSALIALTLIVAVFAWAAWRAGSFDGGLRYLAGAEVIINQTQITVSGQPAERHELVLRNVTSSPVQILGYNAQCSCVRIENLPLKIPPSGRGRIWVLADSHVAKTVPVIMFTNHNDDVPLRFEVRITPTGGGSGHR